MCYHLILLEAFFAVTSRARGTVVILDRTLCLFVPMTFSDTRMYSGSFVSLIYFPLGRGNISKNMFVHKKIQCCDVDLQNHRVISHIC